ncbi:MAG: alpha/beta fold hydrolase [Clostridiales bacterium]|nr:alpha/beta fold hydrolase [Clostridiales bacterium]
MKLFCIPCAGGGASMYKAMRHHIAAGVEVVPIEMSGRGSRFHEPLYDSLTQAAADAYETVKRSVGDDDYCVLGHSMGGLIAFELCAMIEGMRCKKPKMAFFLGTAPPDVKSRESRHLLSDDLFKADIVKMGGIAREFIENDDLFNFYLPVLRSDFRICETYNFSRETVRLDYDIIVLNGVDDDIDKKSVLGWSAYSAKNCYVHYVDGNHFFVTNRVEETCDVINKYLMKSLWLGLI